MNYGGVCRTAPATPGLLTIMNLFFPTNVILLNLSHMSPSRLHQERPSPSSHHSLKSVRIHHSENQDCPRVTVLPLGSSLAVRIYSFKNQFIVTGSHWCWQTQRDSDCLHPRLLSAQLLAISFILRIFVVSLVKELLHLTKRFPCHTLRIFILTGIFTIVEEL